MTDPIALSRMKAAALRGGGDARSDENVQAVRKANAQFRTLLLKELLKPLSEALGPQSGGWGGGSGSVASGFGASGTAANVYGFFWEEALAGELQEAWPLPGAVAEPSKLPGGAAPPADLRPGRMHQLLRGVADAIALDRDSATLPYSLQAAAARSQAPAAPNLNIGALRGAPTVVPATPATPRSPASIATPATPPSIGPVDPEEIPRLSERAGRLFDLPGHLIEAVIMTESSGDSTAVSPKGAQGLMQLMPETARELGVRDALDPWQNVYAGSKYLRQQVDRFGDLELALAAYNAGPGAVLRHGGVPPYRETQTYVSRVLDRSDRLAQRSNAASSAS